MKIYLDHIGIACENLDEASKFWNLIGLLQGDDELVEDQGVVTRFFSTSSNDPTTPKIELHDFEVEILCFLDFLEHIKIQRKYDGIALRCRRVDISRFSIVISSSDEV